MHKKEKHIKFPSFFLCVCVSGLKPCCFVLSTNRGQCQFSVYITQPTVNGEGEKSAEGYEAIPVHQRRPFGVCREVCIHQRAMSLIAYQFLI